MEDKGLRKYNAKFTNKARFRPVRAKDVHEQCQIDQIDMRATLTN